MLNKANCLLLLYRTVSSLGVLTGKLLLGMTKEEIRTVCPEEAGKVFFQLQAIKSSLAVSNVRSSQDARIAVL